MAEQYLEKLYGKMLNDIPLDNREHFKRTMNALWKTQEIQRRTRMLNSNNGRTDKSQGHCHICFEIFLKCETKFVCLDCKNGKVMLCEMCEMSGSPEEHCSGKHNFVKIQ